MTFASPIASPITETITIAEHAPPETLDSGKVRIGAVISIDWTAWEIMHRLLQIWAGAAG